MITMKITITIKKVNFNQNYNHDFSIISIIRNTIMVIREEGEYLSLAQIWPSIWLDLGASKWGSR